MLVCFLLEILLVHGVTAGIIAVDHGTSLQHHLCEFNKVTDNTVYVLSHHTVHLLLRDSLCLIENISNITIRSDASHKVASIQCRSSSSGIAFFNVTNLYMKNIDIKFCGGKLPISHHLFADFITGAIYFVPNQMTTLIFCHNTNFTLNNVIVSSYYGFAIVFINPTGVSIVNKLIIETSLGEARCSFPHYDVSCTGSGVIVYYNSSTSVTSALSSHVTFDQVVFKGNFNIYKSQKFDKSTIDNVPVSALSACMTLIYGSGTYTANVSLTNANFSICLGYHFFSGLAAVYYDPPFDKTTFTVDKCCFDHNIFSFINKSQDSNVGIVIKYTRDQSYQNIPQMISWEAVKIKNSKFLDHVNLDIFYVNDFFERGFTQMALLFILADKAHATIRMENVKYIQKFNGYRSPFIYAYGLNEERKTLNIHLTRMLVHNVVASRISSILPKLLFKGVRGIYIEGPENVFRDITGSIIAAYNSDIHLKGRAIFKDSYASTGVGIHLEGYSYIFVYNSTNVTFENNLATSFGGAISSNIHWHPNILTDLSYCAIQQGREINSIQKPVLNFIKNKALLAGKALYVSNMYDCHQMHLKLNKSSLIQFYNVIFKFPPENNSIAEVSSLPTNVCLCTNKRIYCSRYLLDLYPGETLKLNLSAFDANNTSTYALITATLTNGKIPDHANDITQRLKYNQQKQYVSGIGCTSIDYDINLDNYSSNTMRMWLSTEGIIPKLELHVNIIDCPAGFSVIGDNISCVCNQFLRGIGIHECDINNRLITIPFQSWLGFISISSELLGYAHQCPISYCTSLRYALQVDHMDDICTNNRKGVLCGECIDNHSIVIGSTKCHRCSNKSLYIIGAYIICGILYVALLYFFRWTIDMGTVGGLIFWLDIMTITYKPSSLHGYNSITRYVSFVTNLFRFQWTNIPLCLYDGMMTLHLITFYFVISIYLWIIVVVVIIVSHYSISVANLISGSSVQVLATLIHISMSKLFLNSIIVLTPAHVYIENVSSPVLVWYQDGNVNYGQGIFHILLMIISLLILCLFMLPYIVIGLFGRKMFFIRCIYLQYLRPFVESLYGPYKPKMSYWFGLRSLLVILMYSIYAVLRESNIRLQLLLFILILGAFMIVQSGYMPFKNKLLNFLDLWFMILLEVFFVSSLYFPDRTDSELSTKDLIDLIMQSLCLLTCACIVAYHIILKLKKVPSLQKASKKLECHKFSNICSDLLRKKRREELIIDRLSNYDDDDDNAVRSPLRVLSPVTRSEIHLSHSLSHY